MKRILFFLWVLGALLTSWAHADDVQASASETADDITAIREYLYNLGADMGLDLSQEVATPYISSLLDEASSSSMSGYLYNGLFGALPVNTLSTGLSLFVPSGNTYEALNEWANLTFSTQNYNSASTNTVSVNAYIDQPTSSGSYLSDPVSQFLLNTLGTPDYSYCMNNDGTTWLDDCTHLFQYAVSYNIVNPLPSPTAFFSYDYLQAYLAQLNANTLLSPLMYSTTSTSASDDTKTSTLAPTTQAQTAQDFIRYISGEVTPLTLVSYSDYNNYYSKAMQTVSDSTSDSTLNEIKNAQGTLASYLANLQVYAARASVPISNLYYLFSKRMPQTVTDPNDGKTTTTTSQSLTEFQMATWRHYNPAVDNSSGKQWIASINDASSTTVLKEIAKELADLNYSLYVLIQLNERILLNSSVQTLNSLGQAQPQPKLESIADSTSTDSTSSLE